MSRLVVVVPCYNEAARLHPQQVEEYGRRHDAAELLFVNDGSRDATGELLERLQKSNPRRFSVLHLAKNSGKAEAVRQGLLAALSRGAEYAGYWDADLATPLTDIEPFRRILATQPQIDLVVGTRLKLLGHRIQRQPLRAWLGRRFAQTASLALGVRLQDTQCGAKLLRVTGELRAALAQPFSTRWIFDVELLARLKQHRRAAGLSPLAEAIYEFPLDAWRDVAGSNVRPRDFIKAFGELSRIWWRYCRPGAPQPSAPLPWEAAPGAAALPARPADQQRAA